MTSMFTIALIRTFSAELTEGAGLNPQTYVILEMLFSKERPSKPMLFSSPPSFPSRLSITSKFRASCAVSLAHQPGLNITNGAHDSPECAPVDSPPAA